MPPDTLFNQGQSSLEDLPHLLVATVLWNGLFVVSQISAGDSALVVPDSNLLINTHFSVSHPYHSHEGLS